MRICALLHVVACSGGDPPDGGPCEVGSRDAGATTSLFNGSDLTGWDGDPRFWTVEGGVIVASSAAGAVAENTFLIYEDRTFADFTLRAQVRLDVAGNSGLQYRSSVLDPARWIVGGYQFDMADGAWGNVYEERLGRRVMVTAHDACASAVRPLDWNDIEVTAIGCQITHRLNGELCGVFGEDDPTRPTNGVIALQYHQPGGFRLEYRELSIVDL
jgi:hypothetical protein